MAIFLAAGVTIGAVVGTLTNALKATGRAMGNSLKDIDSKVGSILPGLIGSIVSFLFKTAGQAMGRGFFLLVNQKLLVGSIQNSAHILLCEAALK